MWFVENDLHYDGRVEWILPLAPSTQGCSCRRRNSCVRITRTILPDGMVSQSSATTEVG